MKYAVSAFVAIVLASVTTAYAGNGDERRADPRDVASERAFGMGGNPGRGVRTRTGHNVRNSGHGETDDLTGHGIGLGHQGSPDDPE